jgi:meso-butanediol dehydrogenase/(S,S)-butanediol dehydrogenase/diacetyl reductase
MTQRFEERVALVTGGASGIGAETARRFISEGARVLLADPFGRLDILFDNAGIGDFGETPDIDPETRHKVIAVDLHSVFYGCRAAIPHLRATGRGAIDTGSPRC